MVEAVIVTAALVLALCTPWLDDASPVEWLLSSIASLTGSYVDWLKVI